METDLRTIAPTEGQGPGWTAGPRVDGRDGVEIATWDLGGDGPPLILLHATGFHAKMWLPLAPVLRRRFRVWAIDQRGHGRSGHQAGGDYRDWSDFVADLFAVIDALGLDDDEEGNGLVAAGHSLGGGVLLLADQARPGCFRSLYCYEPIVVAPDQRERLRTDNGSLAVLARKRRPGFPDRASARANYAAKPPFSRFVPEAIDAYVDHGLVDQPDGSVRLACSPEEEASVYEGAMFHRAWEHLGDNRAPAVLAGSTEPDGPAAYLDLVASAHPAATVERWPELDHFAPMEAPATIAGAIVEALGR